MTVGILYPFRCSASCNPSCQFSWTWGNMTSEGSELNLRILHEDLSLNLTCTAVNPATGQSVSVQKVLQVTDGPSSVVIGGVDVVTLGILYGFQCSASCYPACNFTWTWGNVTSQGPELSLKLTQLQAAQNLTCTAVSLDTGRSVTAHKMLQVAAGPSNIQISGPEFLPAGVASNFTCSAECYPSCNYTWSTVSEGLPINLAQGNSVSIIPLPGTVSAPLTCKAEDTLSHLYISTTLLLQVPDGPSSVVIGGVDVMTVGILYPFRCSASCNPSCQFSWTWGNMTSEGSELNLRILHEDLSLNLTCTAVNPATGQSVSVQKVLQVTDGPSSVVIGGVDVVTLGILYGFQCSASCYPACNFTWTWGNVTSQGPELSLKLTQLQAAQNLTCTAVSLDTGRSVTAHKMLQVAAGPSNIQISGPEFLPPGVVSNFTCSAECYPSCNYTWSTVSEGTVFSIPQENSVSIIPFPGTLSASLTCKAQDTLSHLYISTTLPLWVAWPDGSSATHPEQTSAVLLLAFIISAALTL
ncbi:peroxidasin homolog [Archocentrus centrarchus]|uniref:peroxidasin homolog n=1 Tax=Archocentrus centrarchus TaxID=63155 RepID=UPI0011EA4EE9|nr:peroxidasin homolog [Archocentrus centrarchus]